MNYPIPYPQSTQTNVTYLYSNNTNSLGTYNKPIDAVAKLTVDYSQLVPPFEVGLQKVWFEIEPGGEPPLTLDNVETTDTTLTFFLGGGRVDQSYNITINAVGVYGIIQSDKLVVNVTGDDGCDSGCDCASTMNMNNFVQFGTQEVFVNRYPRFFVSATAPTNANLLDRWYNLLDGNWYDYVTDGRTDFWVLSIHGVPPDSGGGGGGDTGITGDITIKKMQPLALDGVTSTFGLVTTDGVIPNITTSHALFVSLDGVWQEPETQFIASGATITFATPPAHDSHEFIMWIFGGIVSG